MQCNSDLTPQYQHGTRSTITVDQLECILENDEHENKEVVDMKIDLSRPTVHYESINSEGDPYPDAALLDPVEMD